jgi:hypothetical protein
MTDDKQDLYPVRIIQDGKAVGLTSGPASMRGRDIVITSAGPNEPDDGLAGYVWLSDTKLVDDLSEGASDSDDIRQVAADRIEELISDRDGWRVAAEVGVDVLKEAAIAVSAERDAEAFLADQLAAAAVELDERTSEYMDNVTTVAEVEKAQMKLLTVLASYRSRRPTPGEAT